MSTLRPFQKSALQALGRGEDVICVAPTGSGKSRIYEIAARTLAHRTVLITPLLALARQQVQGLQFDLGLKSERPLRISACLSTEDRAFRRPPRVGPNESGIWIVSPEALMFSHWQSELRSYAPDFWIVDECHCIWEWNEFRPAYPRLLETFAGLRGGRKPPQSLWMTATLLPNQRVELRKFLGASCYEEGTFSLSPLLDLHFEKIAPQHRLERLWRWLEVLTDSGIIFVSTRESAERLTRLLLIAGHCAFCYHSGLTPEERLALERQFRSRGRKIIVATSAFGMGMDFFDLTWVVVWERPYSVLDLAQRIGRVGRISQKTVQPRAVVFWHPGDRKPSHSNARLEELDQLLNKPGCRRTAIEQVFGVKTRQTPCHHCDFCKLG